MGSTAVSVPEGPTSSSQHGASLVALEYLQEIGGGAFQFNPGKELDY